MTTSEHTHSHIDTLVVGGGISGLAYAHARGPDARVVVLEASARAGGCILTDSAEGARFECGPEALQDDAAETRTLLGELGLEVVPADAAAQRRFVLREAPAVQRRQRRAAEMDAIDTAAGKAFDTRSAPGGRLVEFPTGPGDFLKSELLSRRGKLRAMSEPFRAGGKALDGSVADFVRHRLGDEVLDWMVDPFVSGIYAGDPELVSVRAAFPKLVEMVEQHGSLMKGLKARAKARRAAAGSGDAAAGKRGPPSLLTVKGGLQRLPDALAAALGDKLRLSWPVHELDRDRRDWIVRGPAGELRAHRLIIATGAGMAARLLQAEKVLSESLGSITAESVVSVTHLWRRQDVAHPLDGFGYLVPSRLMADGPGSDSGLRHLGTLFSSSINPACCPTGTVLLRTLLGGARHPELADPSATSAEDLRGIVADEVGAVLGLSEEPLFSSVVTWPDVLPRYDLDHPGRLATIEERLGKTPGLSLLGNYRRGISVNALIEVARTLGRAHV